MNFKHVDTDCLRLGGKKEHEVEGSRAVCSVQKDQSPGRKTCSNIISLNMSNPVEYVWPT